MIRQQEQVNVLPYWASNRLAYCEPFKVILSGRQMLIVGGVITIADRELLIPVASTIDLNSHGETENKCYTVYKKIESSLQLTASEVDLDVSAPHLDVLQKTHDLE